MPKLKRYIYIIHICVNRDNIISVEKYLQTIHGNHSVNELILNGTAIPQKILCCVNNYKETSYF